MNEAALNQGIVCVSVKHKNIDVLDRYVFNVESNQTYSQLLEALFLASARDTLNTRFKQPIAISDKTLIKCFVAKSADFKDKVETNLSIKCVGGCQLFGPFVHFQLNDYKNDEPIVEKRNAFDVLMFAGKAVTLEYPEK